MAVRLREEEVLYDDKKGGLKITYSPKTDLHSLIIGEKYRVYLGNGVLEELASASISDLRNKLDAIDPNFKYIRLPNFGTSKPIDRISIALSQARIKEMKNESRQSYLKERMFRGKIR